MNMRPMPDPDGELLLASDADRDHAVGTLRDGFARGALTHEEMSERIDLALRARTRRELGEIVADLVPARRAREPERVRPRTLHQLREIDKTVAIMSGNTRRGIWRPARESAAVAIMGAVQLDLREAEFEPGLVIRAVAVMGGVDVIVPEGVGVELKGTAIMGGNEMKLRGDTSPVPTIVVEAFSLMGGVTVRTKRLRRRSTERGRATGSDRRLEMQERRRERHERHREHHERHRERHQRRRSDLGASITRAVNGVVADSIRAATDAAVEGKLSRRIDIRIGDHDSQAREQTMPPVAGGSGPATASAGARNDERAVEATVTFLISDIERFTEINERLGDRQAQEVLRAHNAAFRDALQQHGGRYARSTGDGGLAVFDGARAAIRCALDIQQAIDRHNRMRPEHAFRVRIGVHTGEAVMRGDNVFGRDVIVATGIADAADGAEVLVSSTSADLAAGSGEFVFGTGRPVCIDGLTARFEAKVVRRSVEASGSQA